MKLDGIWLKAHLVITGGLIFFLISFQGNDADSRSGIAVLLIILLPWVLYRMSKWVRQQGERRQKLVISLWLLLPLTIVWVPYLFFGYEQWALPIVYAVISIGAANEVYERTG